MHQLKIILAEDDEDDHTFFEEAAMEIFPQPEIKIFPDGQELMDFINEKAILIPDIIFLDINMPRKNGMICLKEIRTKISLNSTPVIMISTTINPNHIDASFEQGANLFVSKEVFYNDESNFLKKILIDGWREKLLNFKKEEFLFRVAG